jgi:hypothetical protein
MTIVTKTVRSQFLRTKSKYYIAGWVDAEQNSPALASTRVADEDAYDQYIYGYNQSMENQYAQGGQ